jgi:hypothetical protein
MSLELGLYSKKIEPIVSRHTREQRAEEIVRSKIRTRHVEELDNLSSSCIILPTR